MKLTTDDGYKIARKVDRILNKALEDFPPEEEVNYHGYLAMLRTIETSINITRKALAKPAYLETLREDG